MSASKAAFAGRKGREHALVIGASITGLTAALALKERGFDVTLVERDPTPDASISYANSEAWTRRGAMHAQQPHILTAHLRNVLRQWYPGLVEALLAAGVWEQDLRDTVHPIARASRHPAPADEEIATFMSRRTTLELAMRRYVATQEGVRLESGKAVSSLMFDTQGPVPKVTGAYVQGPAGEQYMAADIVIDASGRNSRLYSQLTRAGVKIDEEHHESHSIYHTRHYRLRPGKTFPPMYGLPGASFGDMTVAAFPGDNGAFTVTIGAFKDDPLLSSTPNTAVFEKMCAKTTRIAPWIDAETSEPTSPVMSWAKMDFLWRSLRQKDEPQVLGYFLAGDTALRSNPKYGRGCTCGVIGSRLLADALAATSDEAGRLRIYERSLWQAFRDEWEALLTVDSADYARFARAAGLRRASFGGRMQDAFQHHLLNRAMLADAEVQRALMRGFYGLESPSAWMRRPEIWWRIALAAIPRQDVAKAVAENAGRPTRSEIQAWIEGANPA